MSRIDRYILSQFLTLFGFFALVLVSVYWINRAVSLFDDLVSDGQTALVVMEFTVLALPAVISIVLPVAAFVATAYGTNRMADESELVVMQTAGLSPWRMARPVLIFGVFVGLLVAVLVHGLVPLARTRLAERQDELAQDVTTRSVRPGTFQYPSDNVTVFVRDVASDGRLLDVFIEDARDPAQQITHTAKEALLLRNDKGPVLVLLNGMSQNLRRVGDRRQLSVTRFSQFSYDVASMFGESADGRRDLRDFTTLRLLRPDEALLQATGAEPADIRRELHNRIAKPLMAPIAAMIGFATLLIGGYSRFGVWRQVIGASVLLIMVQLSSNAVSARVERDVSLWPAMYLPAILGAAICVMLLRLAVRPWRRGKGAMA
ncbi:LPS export ABC transporter permease LptF [Paracoccus sp. (in: a-proteobacteria)]|uniref:LPS export ABC transporter permease LptF n=1 Tax=Paracoccus sp. TaxID=267 RepID=UPI003A8613B8